MSLILLMLVLNFLKYRESCKIDSCLISEICTMLNNLTEECLRMCKEG